MIVSEDSSAWLEKKLGFHSPEGVWLVNKLGSRILGAVVIHDWTGDDVELTAAGSRDWLSRQFIRAVSAYVFGVLGCQRCTIRTTISNTRMHSIAVRLGFRVEGVMRRARNGEDVVIFGLLRGENRWQRKRHKNFHR